MITSRSINIEAIKIALAIFLFCVSVAKAHDDPSSQIAQVNAALAEDSADPNLYLQRGALYLDMQKYQQAEDDYKQAARLDPKNAAIDLSLGSLYLEMGKLAAAKESLDRFLMKHPQHVSARLLRARVFLAQEDVPAALNDYDAALAVTPDPDVYIERARLQQSSPLQALKGIDEGLQRLGPLPALQTEAIELQIKTKNYNDALARLNTLHFERKENWYEIQGRILEAQGKNAEAKQSYAEALKLLKSRPDYLRNTVAGKALESELRQHAERTFRP